MLNSEEECEVDGAILFLIRTMRMFGVAPVLIRKYDSKHYIRLCRKFMYLGILLTSSIFMVNLIGILHDFSKKSPSSFMLWILDIATTLIVPCLGTYQAWGRVLRAIDYMKFLKQIQQNNKEDKVKHDEKCKIIYIICNLVLLLFAVCLHFYISLLNTQSRAQLTTQCLYSTAYIDNFITCLLGHWYKLIVQTINSSLKVLNSELMDILKDLEHDRKNYNKGKSKERQAPLNLPIKSINKMIDNLAVVQFQRPASAFSKTNEVKIHRLLLQHIRVYDIITTFNSSEGILLLFVFVTYVVYFTNIMYDLISTIRYVEITPLWKLYLMNHCIWCTFTVNNMIAIVEPCQGTAAEIGKTKGLISRMMSYVASDFDLVKNDLEIYFNQLMLYNPNYSPMGVVTLNRSLILTVLGGVGTVVLIFVDFQFQSGFMNV